MPDKRQHHHIAVGISGEGNHLQYVKILREGDNYSLLDAKSYRLAHALEPEAPMPEMDMEPDLPDSPVNGSIDILSGADDADLALMGFDDMDKDDDTSALMELLDNSSGKLVRTGIVLTDPVLFNTVSETTGSLKDRKYQKQLLEEIKKLKPNLEKIKRDEYAFLTMTEQRILTIVREGGIPLYTRWEQVNKITNKPLPYIHCIESIESSLVNLAISQLDDVGEKSISLIVHIGADSSRFIFLKGKEIHHIPEMLGDGVNDPNISLTLFNRLVFEIDSLGLKGLDRVFLSGYATQVEISGFLRENVNGDLPISSLSHGMLNMERMGMEAPMDLALYAPAIGTALRILNAKQFEHHKINLLPSKIKELQNKLMVSPLGWAMVVIILIMSFFTLIRVNGLLEKRRDLSWEISNKTLAAQQYTELENKIQTSEAELANFERSFAIIDSLVLDSELHTTYVDTLIKSLSRIGGFWLTDLSTTADRSVLITGYSMYRNRIVSLVETLPNATLRQAEVQEIREKKVYRFEIMAHLGFAPASGGEANEL